MRSPMTRFTGKRPQSISGITRSITARTRPSWLPRRPTLSSAVLGALAFMLEINCCERRKGYAYRMITSMGRNWRGLHATLIAHAAAAVVRRIGIQHFAPIAMTWHAEQVVFARHRCEVEGDYDNGVLVASLACVCERAELGIGVVDPFEAARVEVHLVQRRFFAVQ